MADINELLTDYSDDDLSKIINDSLQVTSSLYQKMNIYNTRINSPLQKIWIRTPKLKIFRSFGSPNDRFKQSMPLLLLLNNTDPDVKKLLSFIKKLEIKITKIVKQESNNIKIKPRSAIRTIDSFSNSFTVLAVNMPFHKVNNCYEFKFHIYNHNNKRVNVDQLTTGMFAALYLELTEIWVGQSNFGFNWSVMQLKLYPDFNFSKCLFLDENENLQDKQEDKTNECYHCLYCPNNHIRTHYCNNTNHDINPITYNKIPPPPPPLNNNNYIYQVPLQRNIADSNLNILRRGFVPTMEDLLSVKLKPINQNKETDEQLEKELEELLNAK